MAEKCVVDAYKCFQEWFDSFDWKYQTHEIKEGTYVLETGTKGDDFDIHIYINFDGERKLIYISSPLPFQIAPEKRAEVSLAINVINYSLCEGSFDYDLEDGSISYRLTQSLRGDIEINNELCEHLFRLVLFTVENYNDKIFMVSKGKMSLKDLKKDIDSD